MLVGHKYPTNSDFLLMPVRALIHIYRFYKKNWVIYCITHKYVKIKVAGKCLDCVMFT